MWGVWIKGGRCDRRCLARRRGVCRVAALHPMRGSVSSIGGRDGSARMAGLECRRPTDGAHRPSDHPTPRFREGSNIPH